RCGTVAPHAVSSLFLTGPSRTVARDYERVRIKDHCNEVNIPRTRLPTIDLGGAMTPCEHWRSAGTSSAAPTIRGDVEATARRPPLGAGSVPAARGRVGAAGRS